MIELKKVVMVLCECVLVLSSSFNISPCLLISSKNSPLCTPLPLVMLDIDNPSNIGTDLPNGVVAVVTKYLGTGESIGPSF